MVAAGVYRGSGHRNLVHFVTQLINMASDAFSQLVLTAGMSG